MAQPATSAPRSLRKKPGASCSSSRCTRGRPGSPSARSGDCPPAGFAVRLEREECAGRRGLAAQPATLFCYQRGRLGGSAARAPGLPVDHPASVNAGVAKWRESRLRLSHIRLRVVKLASVAQGPTRLQPRMSLLGGPNSRSAHSGQAYGLLPSARPGRGFTALWAFRSHAPAVFEFVDAGTRPRFAAPYPGSRGGLGTFRQGCLCPPWAFSTAWCGRPNATSSSSLSGSNAFARRSRPRLGRAAPRGRRPRLRPRLPAAPAQSTRTWEPARLSSR
jgi:hypothetical protein